VILPAEYSWLESYLDNDSLWLEDAVNWEEAFDLVLSDFTIYNFLTTPFFFNSHFFLDSFTKLSFLDVMFSIETDKNSYSRELYDLFMWDLTSTVYNKFLPLQFLFYTDYQDFMILLLYYSPELMFALTDYINIYWLNSSFNYSPASVFDLFNDSLNTAISEFVEYFILFFSFIWAVVIFVNIFHLIKWNNPLEIYMVRLFNYLFSSSREMRLQFEAFLQVFFFFFFTDLWWLLLLTMIKKN
jgi:hypothetical protein